MSIRDSALYDKVFGCVVGGAIGDAFGIRLEMMHYRDIEAQYGRVTHFDRLPPRQPSAQPPLERYYPFGPPMENEGGFHPLGRWTSEVGGYTDDTRYQLIAYQAILRKRGPIDGADLAEEWLNYRLMAEGATDHAPTWSWPGPERTYTRHLASLPRLIRMATQQRPFTPGWDAPLGLIHAGDPRQRPRSAPRSRSPWPPPCSRMRPSTTSSPRPCATPAPRARTPANSSGG